VGIYLNTVKDLNLQNNLRLSAVGCAMKDKGGMYSQDDQDDEKDDDDSDYLPGNDGSSKTKAVKGGVKSALELEEEVHESLVESQDVNEEEED
jgi:hypothetical protein